MSNFAERVRAHCFVKYIQPAREKGDSLIEIRTGDVHSDLSFVSKLPLVCSSLGALKFEQENNIRRLAVLGPLNGSNTTFVFAVTEDFSGYDPVKCPQCPLWKQKNHKMTFLRGSVSPW